MLTSGASRWYNNLDELVVDFWRSGLYVWGGNPCVVSKILVGCVAVPTPFDFHDVEGDSLQKVFKHQSNSD
jgi:hypothetical protein